jgi:hypothetical protein
MTPEQSPLTNCQSFQGRERCQKNCKNPRNRRSEGHAGAVQENVGNGLDALAVFTTKESE